MSPLSRSAVSLLPRWAMVAFGTRCARRLARYTFDDEDSKLSNHVLALAERAAGLGKPLDAVSAVQAAYDNWSRIFHEISGNRGDATDWARADSAFAISAANAGKLIAKPDPHLATQIIAELEYVEESSVDLNRIRAEIFEDYDRLLKAAERNGWNDSTPVPSHFFAIEHTTDLVLQAVRALSDQLARLVAEEPNALDDIEWRDLERLLANVFRGLGFHVELTSPSKDGGKDLIVTYFDKESKVQYFVEVKHWRSGKLVGSNYVSKFIRILAKAHCAGGIYLATYGFRHTDIELITEVERQEFFTGEKKHISNICRSYARRNNGLWARESDAQAIIAGHFDRAGHVGNAGNFVSRSDSHIHRLSPAMTE